MKVSTTSPARSRMPISVKAYNTFIDRIHILFGHTHEAARMTEAVDLYLHGTPFDRLPLHDTAALAMAFNMLRQEIDRAKTRSLKARQRAATRKAKTTAAANSNRPNHSATGSKGTLINSSHAQQKNSKISIHSASIRARQWQSIHALLAELRRHGLTSPIIHQPAQATDLYRRSSKSPS